MLSQLEGGLERQLSGTWEASKPATPSLCISRNAWVTCRQWFGRRSSRPRRLRSTPPFAAGDQQGTDREVRAAYDGYVAYFGTYEVDEAQGKVIHRVEGSLMPSYTGTAQPRPIKVVGDELIIEGSTPEGRFYRRLRRAR